MNAERCSCVFVYFSFIVATIAMAATDIDKQNNPLKCWNVGKTPLKLCIEDGDKQSSTDQSRDLQMSKKYVDGIFPPPITYTPQAAYNKLMLTDYGEMKVPFFMKKRWYRHSDLPSRSGFPFKMADNDKELSIVNKRPFDSISYNAGLGGFK